MLIRWIGFALVLFATAAGAANTTIGTVASPGNVLQVIVTLDGDGRPGYAVNRAGAPVITESRLGFLLTDAPKLERNFKLGDSATRSADERWEQPWGERHFVRNHYNELSVTLVEKTEPARSLTVRFRVYDDGLGFRYEFPDQPQLKQVNIGDELTEFAVAEEGTAWWTPAGVEPLRVPLQPDAAHRDQ